MLAVAMAVTLSGRQPAWAAAAPAVDWHLKPQVDAAVPVRSAAPSRTPTARPAAPPKLPPAVWPAGGAGEIALPAKGGSITTGHGAVGGLPVTVGPPDRASVGRSANDVVSRVRVEVFDRARTDAAGVRGVLIRVGRADGMESPGRTRVLVDYGAFRHAYGADWALRLRLVHLPNCALTTPDGAACGGRVLPSNNNPAAGTVSADVPVAAGEDTVLALEAGPSSGAGSYAATTLQPSSVWSAGGSSGDFSWSYPLRVPPSLGGPAPKIALAYSAQSVDGRMAASNNQPSWIGEGFEWSPGFIERRYKPCGKDMGAGANNSTETGDLCWVRDNATMSLNGSSTELLFVSGTDWRGRTDDATRVRKTTSSGNGDNDSESWVATTTDGTQYFFGSTAAGTWTAPVFGNHTNEPCHGTAFIDSDCVQAWRWMLDKVVDPNGNTMTFTWVKETNKYARNATATDAADYTRGGYLQRIEYGTRSGVAGTAPMRVEFTTADRCVTTSCGTHNETNWPDTAWDLQCTGSPCTIGSPTFWTTRRLSQITTQLWVSGSTYRDVETWTLTHSFPSPGDGTRAGLWLDKISHSGKIGSTVTTIPDITFDRVQMPNRVDSTQGDWAAAMKWWRISQIHTETGGSINVTYKPADCFAPGGLPAQVHNNTQRCYPVKWIPEGLTSPITDWFHKYVVDTVTESDTVGGADPVSHSYQYLGGAAWHYTDDDGLSADEDKTWSVWRGYATVRTTVGAAPEVQQVTESRYFRGMHGDRQPQPAGPRTVVLPAVGSYAPAVNDEDQFAGTARETIVYDGAAEVSANVTEPWRSTPNASRTVAGSTVEARHTGTAATWRRVTLDGGRAPRITQTSNVFGSYGLVEKTTDHGDIAATGDEQCTLTSYTPRDTTTWLLAYPQRVRTFATTCATAESGNSLSVDDVVGDVRTWYDDTTSFGTASTKGNPTKVEVLKT